MNATDIGRLIFVTLILLMPLKGAAQLPSRVPTIGVLVPGSADTPIDQRSRASFERGLTEHGWRPGEKVRIEYRYADGDDRRLDELARELVRLPVDVMVARATRSIQAAKQATSSIPVVMSASGADPVLLGLVKSLARPDGNVTGLTLLNQDLLVKQLQILREVASAITHAAVLGSTNNPLSKTRREDLNKAARALGIQLHHVDVRSAEELDGVFAEMTRLRVDGLIVRADPFVLEANDKLVVSLAQKHRVPAIYWLERYPQAGGLMSYGADLFEVHRRAAYYVHRILSGMQPAQLPVEEPTKLALIVNTKTARALGMPIPPSFLMRADLVIE